MKILLNGHPKDIEPPMKLKTLIEQVSSQTDLVIAELNGTIIHREQWANRELSNGDMLELLQFVGGG